MRSCLTIIGTISVLAIPAAAGGAESAVVSDLKITTLSTMLTEFRGVGEWGFAALVEADGHTILFDTGMRPDTVLENAAELGVDLSGVESLQAFEDSQRGIERIVLIADQDKLQFQGTESKL